jgi:hypothetical protein
MRASTLVQDRAEQPSTQLKKSGGTAMEIDMRDVVAEVRGAFDRYEQALVSNDLETLDALFRDDPRTVRFGGTENLFGYDQISRALPGRPGALPREHRHRHLWPRFCDRLDPVPRPHHAG